MAQLVERSLPIPEVRGSNPVIGKNYIEHLFIVYCQLCVEKTKIKKKEAMDGPFFKNPCNMFCSNEPRKARILKNNLVNLRAFELNKKIEQDVLKILD